MNVASGPPHWLFVDMDCYFASVEQHLRPELRGRPVGVVPVASDSSCVIAASFDAKQRGVKVGTSVPEARRLCPGIEMVLARPATYVEVHNAVAAAIDTVRPIEKAYSIDEWAIRLRGDERDWTRGLEFGRAIKKVVRERFSEVLTCSVGVAQTRLLAKVACDLGKPDGLESLPAAEVPGRLGTLGVRELPGIARSMEARLAPRGVRTIGDLWSIGRHEAVGIWGSVVGARYWDGLHGVDEPEIATRKHSMSHANVLEPRFRDDDGARRMLVRLVTRLGKRLRQEGYLASELSIQARFVDGRRFSMSGSLPQVHDTPALLERLYELWERRHARGGRYQQVGATVSGLVLASQTPGMLFGQDQRNVGLSSVMDKAVKRWGPGSLYFGSMHGCSHHMDEKIAFGRVPQG
ncbi:MAG: Y-family DNA polymerase [Phycisphaerales bacterium JB064]